MQKEIHSYMGFDESDRYKEGESYHVDGLTRPRFTGFLDPLTCVCNSRPCHSVYYDIEHSGNISVEGDIGIVTSTGITLKSKVGAVDIARAAIERFRENVRETVIYDKYGEQTEERTESIMEKNVGIAFTNGRHCQSSADTRQFRGAVSAAVGGFSTSRMHGEKSIALVTGARCASLADGGVGNASIATNYGSVSAVEGSRSIAAATDEDSLSGARGDSNISAVSGDYSASTADGWACITAATGMYSASSLTGNNGVSSSTGKNGKSVAVGHYCVSAASGAEGVSKSNGSYSISAVTGAKGKSLSAGTCSISVAAGDTAGSESEGHSAIAASSGEQGSSLVKGARGVAVTTGRYGSSSAEGDSVIAVSAMKGSASANGSNAIAVSNGSFSTVTATGMKGISLSNGFHGTAIADGEGCVAVANGHVNTASAVNGASLAIASGDGCCAQGDVGSWLVLSEWIEKPTDGYDRVLKDVKAVFVDGEKIKPNTPYVLVNGKIQESPRT